MGNDYIPYHAYHGSEKGTSRKWKVFEQNTYFWNDDDGTMRVAQVLY